MSTLAYPNLSSVCSFSRDGVAMNCFNYSPIWSASKCIADGWFVESAERHLFVLTWVSFLCYNFTHDSTSCLIFKSRSCMQSRRHHGKPVIENILFITFGKLYHRWICARYGIMMVVLYFNTRRCILLPPFLNRNLHVISFLHAS